MATLTENGIVIERLDSIVHNLEEGFRQIYGRNIYLDPDSPDGQMIGILAQIKMDIEELAENIYKQLDPDLATGAWLEQRVAYAGLVRRQASYSYLRSAILTGEPNTPIFTGLIVSDQNKVRWVLTQDIRLDKSGSGRADFRSEELGAFNLAGNSSLAIETVTLGLNSVTSFENAETGKDEETDNELRQRFFISRSKNAQNSVDVIAAKIAELPDVKQVKVLENNTSSRDKYGVAPHSINVIVEGGEDKAIAEIIYHNKGAGIGLQGARTTTLVLNGGYQTLKFDRTSHIDIDIAMRLVRYEDFTEIDKNEIKRLLTQVQFQIGQPVSLSRLYSPINQVGGFWIKELKIAKHGQSKQSENVAILPREIARILATNIQIEVE